MQEKSTGLKNFLKGPFLLLFNNLVISAFLKSKLIYELF